LEGLDDKEKLRKKIEEQTEKIGKEIGEEVEKAKSDLEKLV
jgi:hypothetical protein